MTSRASSGLSYLKRKSFFEPPVLEPLDRAADERVHVVGLELEGLRVSGLALLDLAEVRVRVAELGPRLVELGREANDDLQVLDGVLVVALELVEDPYV